MENKVHFIKLQIVKERPVEYETGIKRPRDIAKLMCKIAGSDAQESFYVLAFDVKNKLNMIQKVATGTSVGISFDASDVFKSVLLTNSFSIVVCHNHPSGDVTPSKEDIDLTKRIKDGSSLLGIKFMDHLIVTDKEFYSFETNEKESF